MLTESPTMRPEIRIAVALRACGLRIAPSSAEVARAVSEGVTLDQIAAAISECPGRSAEAVIERALMSLRQGSLL